MWEFLRKGFKNGAELMFQQQKTILSGATVIGGMMLLSAVLGLVRKRLYAGILAAGPDYDTLVAAFKLPDLIFQLLIAGTLNAAFIPLFSRYIVQDKAEKAWQFASAAINLTLVIFVFLAGLGFIFATPLAKFLAPGFTADQQATLAHLMRIILLSPLFLGISSFIGGMVQSFRHFFLPFFSPVVYNLGAIFGILFLYAPLGLDGMAWGVLLGSLLHLLVVLPLLKKLGFRYFSKLSRRDPALKEMLRLALPRTIWAAAIQVKEVIIVRLASLLSAGSLSVLDYGESLIRLPVSLFGASIAQAALPSLSEQATRHDWEKFHALFIHSFLQILYLLTPVSVVLIVLKIPIVRVVFGTGGFGWWETIFTAWVLAILAISLFAQAAKELIVRAFYALNETDLPVLVGTFSLLVGLLLSAILLPRWEVRGLALGLSLSLLLEFTVLLLVFMRRQKIKVWLLLKPSLKILFAGLVMTAATYVPVKILDQVFIDTSRVVNLLVLMWVVLTFGGSVYLFLTWLMDCEEIKVFFLVLWKIKSWRETLTNAKIPLKPADLEGDEIEGIE